MKNIYWRAIVGDDIPAVVICGLVFWTWPKFTICTLKHVCSKTGSIRPV